MKAKEMKPEAFKITKYQGGFAIIDVAGAVVAYAQGQSGTEKPDAPQEKYFLVRFNNQTGQNDVPHVPVIVNGWDLRFTRNVDVIVPERHMFAVRNDTQIKWDKDLADMKNPVKANGTIDRYPCSVIREATRKEFEEQLAAGNKTQNEFLNQLRKSAP
jgi:hypothetical protein